MDDEIFSYARQAFVGGASENEIYTKLTGAGYNPDKVSQAIVNAQQSIASERQDSEDKGSFKNWLKSYFLHAKYSIMTLIGIDSILIFLSLLEPWPIKILADSVFGGEPAPLFLEPYSGKTLLYIVSGITILLFLARSFVGYIDSRIAMRFTYKFERKLKGDMFNHIIRLPFYHKERLHKGDYINRLNSFTSDMGNLVLNSTSAVIESAFTIIGVLIVLFILNFNLTLISITVVPLLFVSVRYFMPKIQEITERLQGVYGETANHVLESVENAETIQALTKEKSRVKKLDDLIAKRLTIDQESLKTGTSFSFINNLFVISGTSLIMIVGGTAILNETLTFGSLFIFINYMNRLYGPVEGLTAAMARIRKQLVSSRRVYEVMNDHQEVERPHQGYRPKQIKGNIKFEDVVLRYGEKVILNKVNLDIPAGTKVAFIGPSGGGKSSILKLVSRFLPANEGSVQVDSYKADEIALEVLRDNISIVSQSSQLFSGTILDNLLMGANSQITGSDVEEALEESNSNEFVSTMPAGVSTFIGESGSMLSGGQQQRLAIARGALREAPIIIMDEPSSALDVKSEQIIKRNLDALVGDSTLLLVTHRLSMLTEMDKVYVVDGGNIVDVEKYGGLENYLRYLTAHELI